MAELVRVLTTDGDYIILPVDEAQEKRDDGDLAEVDPTTDRMTLADVFGDDYESDGTLSWNN